MNALVALLVAGAMTATTPTVPQDVVAGDVGDVTLVTSTGKVVNSGDGTTRFFIVAPDGATCPGDSANDQWRTNTFLIPEGDDVLDVWFGSSGPEPPWDGRRYPMFDVANGLPLNQMMIIRNDVAGQPGLVDQAHETSFVVHAQNGITSGRYRMGLACSYFRQTTQYWDLIVDVTAANPADPASLTWRVVAGAGAAVPHQPVDVEGWVGRGLVALGALIVLVLVVTRRRPAPHVVEPDDPTTSTSLRPRTRTNPKEHSS